MSGGRVPADGRASWTDRAIMATSAAFTLLLFASVVWHGVSTPTAAEPTATVTGVDAPTGGDAKVTVVFRNGQDVGIIAATVEVDCGSPPPELTFEHVPAGDRRTGYVTCPAGARDPVATVAAWIEA